ncbi:MAG: RdgB/HAM1 family non-canonical purine NTP pyrophosphatase [Gammaproteobacteria bacterium]|jgi:XTP/dITP diphosphohydrolase|nr:RdgB/HAM1 family non-canonical purine NTP pyrophosphatase [Gammaproteobacteria bacterium]MBT4462501.1 RdgB/HAM1 family non-canonical purine NTP pyrophosphatase [Gammaproteobacteria bacterium]MBT4654748.1 RdgB/HAM1 family non-canonical purine NTP pyrophosphatase [Gammaproteobacteria bacterium]MBT5116535.1 RdgB/HAM1 family non-canonical purine NTP pyrophosphatase [Gammaproteobacteria bacterium]MBT5761621.1 RdgB/HAM1 family non-canonical purine NTP pyrophosphatase [Gammaproteobacteria bacterium
MKIILASRNQDKIKEIKKILDGTGILLKTCNDIEIPEVEETGSTFVENAILKARSASINTGLASIADDSGIEIEYLNGRPGIKSARYSGENATNEMNNIKLLEELTDIPYEKRKACYRCVIVYMRFPDDPFPIITSGSWHGYITEKPIGQNGFGYDPLFFLPEYNKTSAQITSAEKNKISHRAKALNELQRYFRNQ